MSTSRFSTIRSPYIDRVFALTTSTDELELADAEPRESPVQALRQLADAAAPAS